MKEGNLMAIYNEEQQALIDAPLNTKVIGVAGAGTGKTTTILARTKRILREFSTGRVVLITFTRMAANDMRNRLIRQVSPEEIRRITVGTFHSVIGQLIRENAVAVGLQPNFSIIDEASSTMMYRSIIENNPQYLATFKETFIGPEGDPFDKRHPKLTAYDFKHYAGAVSAMVNTAYPQELMSGVFGRETFDRLCKMLACKPAILKTILPVYHHIFRDSLSVGRETNTVNYDHILFIGYLMCQAGMMESFSKSIVHMIVDEYQDTNMLQDVFVRTVGKQHLTIVGDIDQAIYEFRGGKASLLSQHAKEGTVINLTLNYRSFQQILDMANDVIARNETGRDIRKPLRASRKLDEHYGGILATYAQRDYNESERVIERIKFLLKRGTPASEIAILVRSRMSIASINLALQKAKIAVNDTTRFADFMKSDEMQDTLNFIKVFTNPKDIYAFMAIIDRPKRGLGAVALKKLQDNAIKHTMSIIEYLLSDHIDELTPGMRKKVQSLVDVYQTLIEPKNQHMQLTEMIPFLLKNTGYRNWISGLKHQDRHLHNLEVLKGMVQDFQDEYTKTHHDFTLFDIANAFTFEMTASTREEANDGVTIATIHGAKGLEWSDVFVLGMEQENFPGLYMSDPADMEAERRLMYVAVTRAKNSLWLCESKRRITRGEHDLRPSQFLKEVGPVPVVTL